ncbi:hypothetical protein [Vibrio campbellii]|uniref:hypothetical protein n=1 Tax=Vibrio campbellii TaxID=680 RepID=UPI0040576BC4
MFDMNSFALLWSPSQQLLHVEAVGDMISKNRMHFNQKRKSDFIVLGIYKTKDQAKVEASRYQALRNKIYP